MDEKKLKEVLIEKFCEKEDHYNMLRGFNNPMDTGDSVMFTNAIRGVIVYKYAIPMEGVETEYRFNPCKFNHIFNLKSDDIDRFINELPKKPIYIEAEEVCPECDGSGKVEFEYHSYNKNEFGEDDFVIDAECPICEGEGTIYREKESGETKLDEESIISFKGYDSKLRAIVIIKLKEAMDVFNVNEVDVLSVKGHFVARLLDGVYYVSCTGEEFKKGKVFTFEI